MRAVQENEWDACAMQHEISLLIGVVAHPTALMSVKSSEVGGDLATCRGGRATAQHSQAKGPC